MRPVVRCRIFLARHRSTYWLILAALAVASGVVVNGRMAAVESARERWAEVNTVYVAGADHRPDDPLSAVEVELPVAAVPPSALTERPNGQVARRHIAQGEILVDLDVMAVGGPAARAEPGTVVVGVSDTASAASVGVRVRVAGEGLVLANDGIVVDLHDGVVYVAVDEGAAPMVAHAAQIGTASLLYLP